MTSFPIDYDAYSFFKNDRHKRLHKLFLESKSTLSSSIERSDFLYFCQVVANQIEVLINITVNQILLLQPFLRSKLKSNYKRDKLKFIKSTVENLRNCDDYFESIEFIYDIRDLNAHYDVSGATISERIYQRYSVFKFHLTGLTTNITEHQIEKIFKPFIDEYFASDNKRLKEVLWCSNPETYCYVKIERIKTMYFIGRTGIDGLSNFIIDHIKNNEDNYLLGREFVILDHLEYYKSQHPLTFQEKTRNKNNELLKRNNKANKLNQILSENNYQIFIELFAWILSQLEIFYTE